MKKNYTNLANKWRPQSFNDFLEQDHIVTAIKNILKTKKIHNSYIFYGPKGTGKTTLARLFVKGLLCLKGVTDNPCTICSNCLEISTGNCLDLIEIDGASHTKVEEIREILLNMPYMPSNALYKIYLIDEFHMLSKHSFNALLKTLEEPPKHIKFMLVTTEINKIPETILSRSILFNLHLISDNTIMNQLKKIIKKEKINVNVNALNIITKESRGSLRDAITLVDHACLLIENNSMYIDDEIIHKILGTFNNKYIIYVLEKLLIRKHKELFMILYNLDMSPNINWNIFINNLIVICNKLFLIKILCYREISLNLIKIILSKDIILNNSQKNKLMFLASITPYSTFKIIQNTFDVTKHEINNNLFNSRFLIEKSFLKIIILINYK